MKLGHAPPLLSRLLLAVSSIVMVGVVFVFVSRALEPAPIAPPTPPKKAETFNPKADVSKHVVFPQLQTTFMIDVPDLPMGRDNPFVPVAKPTTTSTAIPSEGIAIPGSQLRIVPAQTLPATSTQETSIPTTTEETVMDAENSTSTERYE